MGIVKWVLIAVILVFLGGVAFAAFSSNSVKAQLLVESPSVSVNGKTVDGTVKLSEKDVVATQNGRGTVILHESVLISLEPNSEVTIESLVKEHPKTSQKGRTWTTVTKLAGVVAYSANTEQAVASVRGTGFELNDGLIITGEGSVSYVINGETFTIEAGKAVETVDGISTKRSLTAEEQARVVGFMQRAVTTLQMLRQKEIDSHPILVAAAKAMSGLTDEELIAGLAKADIGEIDVDAALENAPYTNEAILKVADMTKAIQRINQDITELDGTAE